MRAVRTPVAAGVTLLAAFVVLGVLVRGEPYGPDALIGQALHDEWRGPAGFLAGVVSAVLGPVLPIVAAVVLVVAVLRLRHRGRADAARVVARVLVLLLACRATSWVAKPLFARERPRVYPDFAYPSGHVVSVACTGFAIVVLCLWLAPRLVSRAVRIAVLATLLCAASRIVLDVHWLTDTIGAVLAVCGVGLLSGVALRLLPPARRGVASSA